MSLVEEGVETYHHEVANTLDQIESKMRGSGWDMLELEEQGNIMYPITRLYGVDGFTSAGVRERIDRKSDIPAKTDRRYRGTYRPCSYGNLSVAESNTEALFEPAPIDKSSKFESALTSTWRS